MVTQYVVDPQKDQNQTILELAQKLNEVIAVLSQPAMRAGRPPGPAQYIEYLSSMAKRLETGPLKQLSEAEPNELTVAIGDALSKFQAAVEAYKKSLVGTITPEG